MASGSIDPMVRRHLEAVFKMLDLDKSGYIEEEEGLKIGQTLGCNPPGAYWAELCKMCDSDGDGRVSMEEYVVASGAMSVEAALGLKEEMETKLSQLALQTHRMNAARLSPLLEGIFEVLDATSNGTLSRAELDGFVDVLSGQAMDAAQRAGIAGFSGGLDALFQNGLKTSLSVSEFAAYTPEAEPTALSSFVTMASELLAEPDLLRAQLDEVHMASAGRAGLVSAIDGVPSKAETKLRARFQEFDVDGDGYLSKEEIGDLLLLDPESDAAELDALWAKADLDNDGKITFDEFAAAQAHFAAAELAMNASVDDLLPM
jgi:Ca2+-binding EF-hand superfamily protein